jgi:hypothetical protein
MSRGSGEMNVSGTNQGADSRSPLLVARAKAGLSSTGAVSGSKDAGFPGA